ncbi:MAG: IS607 family transposase [Candidatus Woesearchaeota archaeon]|nr:MAG: IS607 family transposase [Candidatus Woesearchaeota archaeon]
MKLSEWAKQQGISYRTAWNWFRQGKLPVSAIQTPSGTILVQDSSKSTSGKVVVYARVSSADQKSSLDQQVARCVAHATSLGLAVDKVVTEVGSGVNGRRKKLMRVLRDPSVTTIVVEHRDRLTRFGFDLLEASLASRKCNLIVVDPVELENDLVRDMIDVLTSFCARLYGQRAAKRKARKALEVMQCEHTTDG